MKTATVTVKYLNPPKGLGPASIKDTNNVPYKFWINSKFGNGIPLETFQEGGTYTIGYKTAPGRDGKDEHTIQEVQDVTGEQVMAAPKHPAPFASPQDAVPVRHGQSWPTNGDRNRDEQIFVCGIVNNAVAAGKVDPISAAEILDVTKAASAAFHAWRKE